MFRYQQIIIGVIFVGIFVMAGVGVAEATISGEITSVTHKVIDDWFFADEIEWTVTIKNTSTEELPYGYTYNICIYNEDGYVLHGSLYTVDDFPSGEEKSITFSTDGEGAYSIEDIDNKYTVILCAGTHIITYPYYCRIPGVNTIFDEKTICCTQCTCLGETATGGCPGTAGGDCACDQHEENDTCDTTGECLSDCTCLVTPPPTCDGICNKYCDPSCSGVDEDPDCGCKHNDGCCGIDCVYVNDNDCPPPSCSGTLSVNINGKEPCSGNASITATKACEGKTWEIKGDGSPISGCSGSIPDPLSEDGWGYGTSCLGNNINQGDRTYQLYIDNEYKNSAGGYCPPKTDTCPFRPCVSEYDCNNKITGTCLSQFEPYCKGIDSLKPCCCKPPGGGVCGGQSPCKGWVSWNGGKYGGYDGSDWSGWIHYPTSIIPNQNKCTEIGGSWNDHNYCTAGEYHCRLHCLCNLCNGGECQTPGCTPGDDCGSYSDSCDSNHHFIEYYSNQGRCNSDCSCVAPGSEKYCSKSECSAQCETAADCPECVGDDLGKVRTCNLDTCTCECVPCTNYTCNVESMTCPAQVKMNDPFTISFSSYTGLDCSNIRELYSSSEGSVYKKDDSASPCITVKDDVYLTAPNTINTYTYEARCYRYYDTSYTAKQCEIEVVCDTDAVPPNVSVNSPQCFCSYSNCDNNCSAPNTCCISPNYHEEAPSPCDNCQNEVKVFLNAHTTYIQYYDVQYAKCLSLTTEGDNPFVNCQGLSADPFNDYDIDDYGNRIWLKWKTGLGPETTFVEFTPGADDLDHIFVFRSRVIDICDNVGDWSNPTNAWTAVVNECFEPTSYDFSFESPVPETLDLSAPKTIFLNDIPAGATVTSAPIKVKGGSSGGIFYEQGYLSVTQGNTWDSDDIVVPGNPSRDTITYQLDMKRTIGYATYAYIRLIDEDEVSHDLEYVYLSSSWQTKTYDISEYAGQTIKLSIYAYSRHSEFDNLKISGIIRDYPKDLTIKVGAKEVYKYSGKFGYEKTGMYGLKPQTFSEAGSGYIKETGDYRWLGAGVKWPLTSAVSINFTHSLQNILGSCPSLSCEDAVSDWLIPIKVSSESVGKITLSGLTINGSATNFASGNSSETIEFYERGSDTSVKIRVSKSETINSATLNMEGKYLNAPYECASQILETHSYYVTDKNQYAQSFRTRGLTYITKVDLWLSKDITGVDNVTVEIREDRGGLPKSYASAKVIKYNYDITDGWNTFDFPDTLLRYGSRYWIIVKASTGDNEDNFQWKWHHAINKNEDAYPNGRMAQSYDYGKSWQFYGIYCDYAFKAYCRGSYPVGPILDIGSDESLEWKYGYTEIGEITDDSIPFLKIKPQYRDVMDPVIWLNGDKYQYTGTLSAGTETSFDISSSLKKSGHNVLNFEADAEIDWTIFGFKKITFNPGHILKGAKIKFKRIAAIETEVSGGHGYVVINWKEPAVEPKGTASHAHIIEIDGQKFTTSLNYWPHYHLLIDYTKDKKQTYYWDYAGTHTEKLDLTKYGKGIYTSSSAGRHIHKAVFGWNVKSGERYRCQLKEEAIGEWLQDAKHPCYAGEHSHSFNIPPFNNSSVEIDGKRYVSDEDGMVDLPDYLFDTGDESYELVFDAGTISSLTGNKVSPAFNWEIVGNIYQQGEPDTDVDLQVPAELTNAHITFVGNRYWNYDTQNLSVIVNEGKLNQEVIDAGSLGAFQTATFPLTKLKSGVNTLDFSTDFPHNNGSGLFGWKITGDLTRTIDLSAGINEYIRKNCADTVCSAPITFSGVGSTISLQGFGEQGQVQADIILNTETACQAYNKAPTAEVVGRDLGCIWPLVTLNFDYKDADGHKIRVKTDKQGDEDWSYQIQISSDRDNFEANILADKVITMETAVSSGATIPHPIDNPLPVLPVYYWRAKVWDEKGSESNWSEGFFDIEAL